MKNKIKLNNDLSVDLDKLIQSRMVILANSGGGKSWAIRRIAEQAVEQVQTIIIDPEGEFSSLREKFDFILCGKNADVPVEVRSASLLATKLLELNKSAIIDLYELSKQDRQRFVKIFFNTMVDAPKELYHPVIVVLDEAHDYVPEGKPSEATQAVEDMASKGRKRGQCLILASQRISKLSKNASAECNNKLIGRASQDIDYTRAGAELGFGKEDSRSLKTLKPGEFYSFGPAISDDVELIKIGDIKTSHAKVGYKSVGKVPPASDVIKKVLSELKDLPQEAEKEAKTVSELKAENAKLKKIIVMNKGGFVEKKVLDQEALQKAVMAERSKYEKELFKRNEEYLKQVNNWFKILEGIGESMKSYKESVKPEEILNIYKNEYKHIPKPSKNVSPFTVTGYFGSEENELKNFGKCSKAIYSYLVRKGSATKTQVAVATGYSQNSGGFNNSISELSAAGLITRQNGSLAILDADGNFNSDLDTEIDTSLQKWTSKLGACSRKIWQEMLAVNVDETWTKEQLGNQTGYSPTSGGFNNSLSELSALGLIERLPGGVVRVNPEITNL